MKREDLLKTKIKIPNEEIAIIVQKKLFEMDIDWHSGRKELSKWLKDMCYLYISHDGNITYSSGFDSNYFANHKNREVSYEDILNIKHEPKFGVGDIVKVISCYSNNMYNCYIGANHKIKNGIVNKTGVWYTLVDGEGWFFKEKDLKLISKSSESKSEFGLRIHKAIEEEFNKTEEKKMELKECNKKNLKEAAKKVAEERMNAEVEFAASKYREITDEIDRLNREIKRREELKAELVEKLKLFQ